MCCQSPPKLQYKMNVYATVSFKDDYTSIAALVCNSEGKVMAARSVDS